ncbi:hypothetical protein HanOQP8_Chr13g0503971 [Helianthus annuus]|nr:hypothetical protein HanOQP8_Chr13g0503971 [Helianthus annuus]KAJ0851353.1 hypothetical protein HanPSC8_Chr13g0591241 [Helianthus annuus]
MDPTVAYFPAYYYGGYDGATNDYSRFLNLDGVDMSQGVYGENGSVMYPGYGYAPYGPYSPAGSPVPTTGHDGQLYGAQQYQYQYQYPSPCFQPVVDTTASGITKGNTGAALVRPVANKNPVFSSNGSYDSGSQKCVSGSNIPI